MHKLLGLTLLLFSSSVFAQYPKNPVKPTSADDRMVAVMQRMQLKESSAYSGIKAENIGPTIMSGRVVDVAVDPANSKHFFVAYATGGIWETKNNGHSFDPIFDNNGVTIHCGALAVNWESKTMYVGTGEANSSRSSYAGYGLFVGKLTDTGTIWSPLGLKASQHISRIIIHPDNPRILFAACMGNLFSPNKERGVYKSDDSGLTWNQVLYIDENTSAVDLEINPKNTTQLIAAMWQKSRRAWNFWGSGENSGVYLSNDVGETWDKSKDFPSGENVGRIGLSVARNGVTYALFDNQERYKKDKPADEDITKKSFLDMTNDSLRNIADSTLNDFLESNRFPSKYKAKDIKKMVKKGDLVPKDLYDFLADANAALFEDPVVGAELWGAGPFGNSWRKKNTHELENVFYSYGYYFGTVHVNYSNSKEVYIAGVPLLKSKEGGTSFEYIGASNVHVDHHFIWVNPNDPQHLINGNDGGINISYDGGKNWTKCNSPSVGQFYTVAVDTKKNYSVYGGLQDNGVWKGPNNYKASKRWMQEGQYPYKRLMGGDGMQIQIDSRDNTVYTGYQFGHYFRKDPNGKSHYFHPTQDLKRAKTPLELANTDSYIPPQQ